MSTSMMLESNRSRELFKKNPGYGVFSANYVTFLELPLQKQYDFLLHDAIGPSAILPVTAEFLSSQDPAFRFLNRELDHRFRLEKDPVMKMELMDQWVRSFPEVDCDGFMQFYGENDDALYREFTAFREIFPIFKKSVGFINYPTFTNFQELSKQKIHVQTILDMFHLDIIRPEDNILVHGQMAIILINLIQNARRYGGNNIKLEINDNSICVINESPNPLPDNLFTIGAKGKTGNFGYGLFISKRLYAPLIGYDITADDKPLGPEKHQIIFTLHKNDAAANKQ